MTPLRQHEEEDDDDDAERLVSPEVQQYIQASFKLAKQKGIPKRSNCKKVHSVVLEKWRSAPNARQLLTAAEWGRNVVAFANAELMLKFARRHESIGKKGRGVVQLLFGNGFELVVGVDADVNDFNVEWSEMNTLGVGVSVSELGDRRCTAERLYKQIGTLGCTESPYKHFVALARDTEDPSSVKVYMHTIGPLWDMTPASAGRMLIFNLVTNPDNPFETVRTEHLTDLEKLVRETGKLIEPTGTILLPRNLNAGALQRTPLVACPKEARGKTRVVFESDEMAALVNAFQNEEDTQSRKVLVCFGKGRTAANGEEIVEEGSRKRSSLALSPQESRVGQAKCFTADEIATLEGAFDENTVVGSRKPKACLALSPQEARVGQAKRLTASKKKDLTKVFDEQARNRIGLVVSPREARGGQAKRLTASKKTALRKVFDNGTGKRKALVLSPQESSRVGQVKRFTSDESAALVNSFDKSTVGTSSGKATAFFLSSQEARVGQAKQLTASSKAALTKAFDRGTRKRKALVLYPQEVPVGQAKRFASDEITALEEAFDKNTTGSEKSKASLVLVPQEAFAAFAGQEKKGLTASLKQALEKVFVDVETRKQKRLVLSPPQASIGPVKKLAPTKRAALQKVFEKSSLNA